MEIADDLYFELERKMSYDDFSAAQIKRKGYVCPACEHYKNDCIVYGRKSGRW